MSSAEKAAGLMLKLEPEDFRVLTAIELGMANFYFVPFEEIVKYSSLDISEINFRLKELDMKNLIYRQTEPYLGFILNYTGYDCLALNALAKANLLNSLGKSLGVGKEADIYDGITDYGERVAVKFHRLGRTSFRETKKKRGYVAKKGHVPWHYQSRLASEKEFQVMKTVFKANVSVPKPIHQNRHVIVMSFIDGHNLVDVDTLDEPKNFLKDIILEIRKSYSADIIHGDLSEYNVVVQQDGKILLIDWPQAVTKNHPNANALLERDIKNIIHYFKRKFNLEYSFDTTKAFIMS